MRSLRRRTNQSRNRRSAVVAVPSGPNVVRSLVSISLPPLKLWHARSTQGPLADHAASLEMTAKTATGTTVTGACRLSQHLRCQDRHESLMIWPDGSPRQVALAKSRARSTGTCQAETKGRPVRMTPHDSDRVAG